MRTGSNRQTRAFQSLPHIKVNTYEKSYFDLTIIRKVGFGVKIKGSRNRETGELGQKGDIRSEIAQHSPFRLTADMLAPQGKRGAMGEFVTLGIVPPPSPDHP